MSSNVKSVRQALNSAFLRRKVEQKEIDVFKKEFNDLLSRINPKESEEYHKNLIKDFLNKVYYEGRYYINTKKKSDLVIHNKIDPASSVGVLMETKNPRNKEEMVSRDNLNVKSFHELVWYYLQERKTEKNFELRHLIITNIHEWFIFDAQDFEKLFYQNKKLGYQFEEFQNKKLAGTSTDFFYKDIVSPTIKEHQGKISYTYFNIDEYAKKEDDRKLIELYKFLSPIHLLKLPVTNERNQLNKEFYDELLHIIGLEEIKQGNDKLISRKKEQERDDGSVIENAMNVINEIDSLENIESEQDGKEKQERLFDVALDLTITWINRVLFLKLLEAQIIKYHDGNKNFSFLSVEKLSDYGDLNSLFFSVLARKEEERKGDEKTKFKHVPYLNSSLFEKTDTEKAIVISNLKNTIKIKIYSKTVLRNADSMMQPLKYLLQFLDAYDFSCENSKDIQEENKPLISAAVLGLIFEKINGYKDGSFFTPSTITMYICSEIISKVIIQKFNDAKNWNCQTIKDLYNKIENISEANEIFNSVRICDPSVGSGHFLVSALNKMISLKCELGILTDKTGKKLKDYRIDIKDDELIISDNEGKLFAYNSEDEESSRVQETFFHEKQMIIEHCLFGVDINPNSVKICQLRLWIELLKHSYYLSPPPTFI